MAYQCCDCGIEYGRKLLECPQCGKKQPLIIVGTPYPGEDRLREVFDEIIKNITKEDEKWEND